MLNNLMTTICVRLVVKKIVAETYRQTTALVANIGPSTCRLFEYTVMDKKQYFNELGD